MAAAARDFGPPSKLLNSVMASLLLLSFMIVTSASDSSMASQHNVYWLSY